MGMYENPGQYTEDQGDFDPLFPQVDPVQRAAEMQRERLAREAEEKADRAAKEARKKADKEAKVAQKLANKVTKDLEQKAEKVTDVSQEAKEAVAEAKEAVAELSEELNEHVQEVVLSDKGEPVEMAFTNGSEYIAELKEGEEAIFDLTQSTEKVDDTIDLADEVAERAQALARARAALDEVVAGDMGVESSALEESREVFGIQGPSQDIRDRLRSAWEPTATEAVVSETIPVEAVNDSLDSSARMTPVSVGEVPLQASSDHDSVYAGNYNVSTTPITASETDVRPEDTPPDTSDRASRGTGALRTATVLAGGYIAGRANAARRGLERVESTLRSQVSDLQGEVARSSSIESKAPVTQTTRPETVVYSNIARTPEIKNGQQDAIPSWIRQVESDVRRGKVLELKKWQRDVLKSQHPELLKKYDKIDAELKMQLKHQSVEPQKAESLGSVQPKAVSQMHPGDLPSFTPLPTPMPAFMNPSAPAGVNLPPTQVRPASPYEYATQAGEPVFSSAYITIVTIGGLLFGAFLITVFGL